MRKLPPDEKVGTQIPFRVEPALATELRQVVQRLREEDPMGRLSQGGFIRWALRLAIYAVQCRWEGRPVPGLVYPNPAPWVIFPGLVKTRPQPRKSKTTRASTGGPRTQKTR